jgi:hypothetical protein
MHSKSPEPKKGQLQKPRSNQFFPRVQRVALLLGSIVVIGIVSRTSPKLLNNFSTQSTAAVMDTNKVTKGVNTFGNTLFGNLGENVSN